MIQEIKMRAGNYWIKVKTWQDEKRIYFRFGFNRTLMEEIKCMEGPRWDGERKAWSVNNSFRNQFQISFLKGENPYSRYEQPLIDFTPSRVECYQHQIRMTQYILTFHHVILAAEQGTGKTLAAIEAIEAIGRKDVLWVGPKSALAAVELEFFKWRARITPVFITYDKLKSVIETWPIGQKSPSVIIFDESSKIKSPNSQRSIAAMHLTESHRADWGNQGHIVLMSGTPAPKSPVDWWHQCETACPGFIREGTPEKFRRRLGIIVDKENLTGGVYPHLLSWLDDERKCRVCGQFRDHANHDVAKALFADTTTDFHAWEQSTNEIEYLYKRMKGLALVIFKKDVLELPDKIYRIWNCPPSQETLNAAKLIAASAKSTITGLILLRELSDGFQYQQQNVGFDTCPRCEGSGQHPEPVFTGFGFEDSPAAVEIWESDIGEDEKQQRLLEMGCGYEILETSCLQCSGTGQIPRIERKTVPVKCPKDDALRDILDTHDDDGRLVVYAGFTASIDRIVQLLIKAGWGWIKVDGRGWSCSFNANRPVQMLDEFQSSRVDKICFVGHPGSAGMGLTLTKSSEIVFWSNDFNGESRIQAEDRAHRPGMDLNKGCTITDLVHLPTDQRIIDNLKLKKKLQDLSLGLFTEVLK